MTERRGSAHCCGLGPGRDDLQKGVSPWRRRRPDYNVLSCRTRHPCTTHTTPCHYGDGESCPRDPSFPLSLWHHCHGCVCCYFQFFLLRPKEMSLQASNHIMLLLKILIQTQIFDPFNPLVQLFCNPCWVSKFFASSYLIFAYVLSRECCLSVFPVEMHERTVVWPQHFAATPSLRVPRWWTFNNGHLSIVKANLDFLAQTYILHIFLAS